MNCIFQNDEIYRNFSIAENILLRDYAEKDRDLIEYALDMVGMSNKVNSMKYGIHTKLTKEIEEEGVYLSRGEQQLLILARIFIDKKEVIVLDEPFNHISQNRRSQIMQNINQFYDEKRREILLVLRNGKICSGDLAKAVKLSPQALSYHLTILKKSDLIFESKYKNFIFYELHLSVLDELYMWLNHLKGESNNEN